MPGPAIFPMRKRRCLRLTWDAKQPKQRKLGQWTMERCSMKRTVAMQLEAIEQPIKYRLRNGNEVTLRPGVPTELPDQAAKQLLRKAPDKVRLVQNVSPIRSGALITWQGADGKPRGPAIVEFLHT